MAQKNFSLPDAFIDWFENWCKSNGYTQTAMLQAALHKFSQMSHIDRIKWFKKVGSVPRETPPPDGQLLFIATSDDQSRHENEA